MELSPFMWKWVVIGVLLAAVVGLVLVVRANTIARHDAEMKSLELERKGFRDRFGAP